MENTATAIAATSIAELKAELHTARQNSQTLSNDVAVARESLDDEIARLTGAWQASNAKLISASILANTALAASESALRKALIANYKATGEKTFDKDCGVRVTTKLSYDEAKAIEWAKVNAPVLVVESVDKKAFEKMPMVNDLDFVTVAETATATLAKDFTL